MGFHTIRALPSAATFYKTRLMDKYLMKRLEIILLRINYCPSLKLRLDLAAPKLNQEFKKQEGILCDSTGESSLFFCLWSV